MKKAAVISPYWETLGGGEKYLARAGKVMVNAGLAVEAWWKDPSLPHRLEERFGFATGMNVNPAAHTIFTTGTWWEKRQLMKDYELLFVLTDGSLPWLWSKKNILHFQVPFVGVQGRSWVSQLKLKQINRVICNSHFTKKVIDQEFKVSSEVIYPPIHLFSRGKKDRYILSVGRFDTYLHAKKQDVLIEAFNRMALPEPWELVLAGGLQEKESVLEPLRKLAKGRRVTLVINPTFAEIRQLYAGAPIYWHAAGFGANLIKEPYKAEHFGMATVEAMSAGAIPLVFDGGGQKEIISQGKNGYLWQEPDELIAFTRQLVTHGSESDALREAAIARALDFKEESFDAEIKQAIG
jgi:glycosyltransferase involved in cell wall biosynthesis